MGILKIIKKNRMLKNKRKTSAFENNSPDGNIEVDGADAQPQPVVTQAIQESTPAPKQEKAKSVRTPTKKSEATSKDSPEKTAVKKSPAVSAKKESPKKTTAVTTATTKKTDSAKKQEPASQNKTSAAKNTTASKKVTEDAKPIVAATPKKAATKEAKPDAAKKSENATAKEGKSSMAKTANKATIEETKLTVNEEKMKNTAEAEIEIAKGYTGKFEINKSKDGKKFFFNLYASNKVGIATSQMYSSSQGALNGVKSVIANAPTAPIEDQSLKKYETLPYPKWEIYVDNGGKFRFRLHASNGSCVCHSQGYTTKTACKNGIDSIIRSSKNAEIDKTYITKKDEA